MLEYRKGNLLSVTSGIIAHGCNAQGVMGSGVAFQIKNKYPEAYLDYLIMPKRLGEVSLVKVTKDLYVANCITQEYYGRDKSVVYVDYDAINLVMNKLCRIQQECTVNMPKIGAGLANGDWSKIERIIQTQFEHDLAIVWEL